MESVKNKVKDVLICENKESQHAPVLLNFQNGILNKDAAESVKYFEAIQKDDKHRVAVITATNDNIYNGKIEKPPGSDLINTFIAVRKKGNNKVRIVQIDAASMINHIYNKKSESPCEISDDLSRKLVVKNFGGRKAIRLMERSERTKVNVDIVKEQLNKTIENTEISEESKVDADVDKILPPMNEDAEKVEDVYSLTNIISDNLLDRLNDECYAILESQPEELPIDSQYIKKRIEEIHSSSNPKSVDNLRTLKILLYMEGLANLIKAKQRILSKFTLSNITEKIENHIKDNFTDPNLKSRMKTKFTTDKALCYYIVLALLINGYEIEINTLKQELSIPQQKITKYARIVKAIAKPGTGILRLQLPKHVKINLVSNSNRRRTK